MTQIELKQCLLALQEKRNELVDENRGRGSLVIESAADEMDQTQGSQEREWVIGSLDRNTKLLRRVMAALGRIDGGTFGICLNCESEIVTKRLAAVPWAALCIVCQEAEDANGGAAPDETEDSWVHAA
jgi:DnaK suppressor protein